jgi:DNA modification methylase
MRCHFGDSATVMRQLVADGVRAHLCVTSPPYDALRTYGGHTWDFEATALALYDILVDGGIVCWNVGDSVVDGSETLTSAKQKIFFREQCGFRIHDTMIWHKANFANPEKIRYHQVFEYVFILSKGAPRCFNPIKDKPNSTAGRVGAVGTNTYTMRDGDKSTRPRYVTEDFGMRGNVWYGKTRGQEEFCRGLGHPAMMPKWLARDLIYSWSNSGDVVIDPFAGSCTTQEQAQLLGRESIAIEINSEYAPLQRRRTAQAGMVFA